MKEINDIYNFTFNKLDNFNYSNTQNKIGKEFSNDTKVNGDKMLKERVNKLKKIVKPPYKNSSKETLNEIKYLIKLQKNRSINLKKNIINEMKQDGIKNTFKRIMENNNIDKNIIKDQLTRMDWTMDIANIEIYRIKKEYDRIRPEYLIKKIKSLFSEIPIISSELFIPWIPTPTHPAYPSGHATQCMCTAIIQGHFDNDNKKVYIKAAKEVARNREIGGVHYPSDTEAGFILGKFLAEEKLNLLIKNDIKDFHDLDKLNYLNTQNKIDINYKIKKKGDLISDEHIKKIVEVIGYPPCNTSETTIKELKYLTKLQNKKKFHNYFELAKNEIYTEGIKDTFKKIMLEGNIDENKIIINLKLMDFTINYGIDIIYRLKIYFNRIRPEYLINTLKYLNPDMSLPEKINILNSEIKTPYYPSYPSGHATFCFCTAKVLSHLDNKNKFYYYKAAKIISENREYSGLNFRSDIIAGYKLGDYLGNNIIKNNNFKKIYIKN